MSVRLPANFNARPIMDAVIASQPITENLTCRLFLNILDSNALSTVSLATIKNLPHTLSKKSHLTQSIVTRIRYVETLLMSLASLVHNLVFATIFTALTLVTLGQVKKIRELGIKYFTHAGLALASSCVSLGGVVSPKAALGMNMGLWYCLAAASFSNAQNQLSQLVCGWYTANRVPLKAALIQSVNQDREFTQRFIEPLFNSLDKNLDSAQTRSIEGLKQAFFNVCRENPQFLEMGGAILKEVFKLDGESATELAQSALRRFGSRAIATQN
ncbi:MAG TPA: hypothetical protein VGJ00_07655 [Rhabdochlamydiaceae bacterium]|jgi:hypothetical protein